MALCNGLSNLICLRFRNTNPSQSTTFSRNRMNDFTCSVADPYPSQAAETQRWSIADDQDIYSTTPSSSVVPHQYTHLHTCFPDKFSMEHEQKIENVRKLLKSKGESENSMESLILVDAIQRLGVSSHFEKEIDTILSQTYAAITRASVYSNESNNTLHDVSLFFRLLRQHGHCISSDVFENFRGKDGKFKGRLRQDVRGLVELYEAAQLRFEGEDILDEAAKFCSLQLLKNCDLYPTIVAKKLKHPYHKSIARVTAKYFEDSLNIEGEITLRELAIWDSRMEQSLYKQELFQISKWWNGVGLAENLKLARNQPLKWYAWSMAALIDDITLSQQRVELTKSIAFIYLIDDIFDLYGTIDELIIFTDAINKWDYAVVDMLPEYMKMCYRALLDTTNEIAHKIYEKHGYNPIHHLKTTWSSLCDAFLVEAKWFASGKLPCAEEYLENGKVSSGIHVVLVHLFFLLDIGGGGAHGSGPTHLNEELMSTVATILRLWDDLGSAKDEHQDGKDGSYVECYMQEQKGLVSVEQARERVTELIAKEWKYLNKECLCLNNFSAASSFKKACLNVARMVPLMYSYDDNQRLPLLQEYLESTLCC